MRPSHLLRPLALALLAAVAGILLADRAGLLRKISDNDPSRLAPGKGSLEGRVAGLPEIRLSRTQFVLEADAWSPDSGTRVPIEGRVLVQAAPGAGLEWGGRVRLEGRLELPRPPSVPGRRSYREHLALLRIHSLFRAESVQILKPAPVPLRILARLRDRMNSAFERLGPVPAGVFKGIVLGEKALGKDLQSEFRDAGAVHLLVASGSNVTFVLVMVLGLTRALRLPRGAGIALGLLATGIYTAVAGAEPPLLRAYAMTVAGVAGYLLERESGAFQGLILAALALLAWDPLVLFQPGFQMSFLACLGIIIAVSNWKVPRSPAPLRYAVGLLWVSIAAQLALFPVLALYFHRISLVSVASNILLVPWAGMLMGTGFALFAASFLSPLFELLLSPAAGLAWAFVAVVKAFAALPLAGIWVPSPDWFWMLLYYVAALLAWFAPDRESVKRAALGGGLLLAVAFPVRLLQRETPSMTFMGSVPSTALLAGGKKPLLLNAALEGEELTHAVLDSGSGLDAVVLTSLRQEHWRGLEALSRNVKIGRVLAPPGGEPDFERLAARLSSQGISVERWWPGTSLKSGPWEVTAAWSGYSGHADRDRLELALGGPGVGLEFEREPGLSRLRGLDGEEPFDIMPHRGPVVAMAEGGRLRVSTLR